LKKLASISDILVENYIPGTLSKYGLGYPELSKDYRHLIYASITGYGQTGPYKYRAGYDVMVEAEMGLMHITGEPGRPPVKVGVAVTDLTTGLYTSNSIMAALIARGRTGRGQHIDASLSDVQVATLTNIASSVLISGEPDSGRHGTAHGKLPKRHCVGMGGGILIPTKLPLCHTSRSQQRMGISSWEEGMIDCTRFSVTNSGNPSGSLIPGSLTTRHE
jgi:succinate--hydroxymethylglutarate CoA-transferase